MNKLNDDVVDFKEFKIKKENNEYIVAIGIKEDNIIMKIESYELELYHKDIQKIMNITIENNSIEKMFEFFIESFEKEKVSIKEILINKILKLVITYGVNNKENHLELILINKKENKYCLVNLINQNNLILKNKISQLLEQNKKLKEEINLLKPKGIDTNNNKLNIINRNISFFLNKTELKSSSPLYIQFNKNIAKDSYAHFGLENTFLILNSIQNISYIIYPTKSRSIITQNISNFQKMCEVKKAHEEYITNLRHFLDKKNKRDIIMSISSEDNNIKLWDFRNWACLSDIKDVNQNGSLYSACFYQEQNENDFYIITSNDNYSRSESIKVLDFKGNKIKKISNSKDRTFLVDVYYDNRNKFKNNYIVSGIFKGIKSYNIKENKIYHEYFDIENDYYYEHNSIVFYEKMNEIKMIESSEDGNIRIWDFHSAKLLNRIFVSDGKLYGLCLWDKDYLFVGCDDNKLKLIDLRKDFVLNNIEAEGLIISIRKIEHIKYKECLITIDWKNKLKIWTIKD